MFRFLDSALAPSYVSSLPEQSNVDLLKYVMQDGGSQLPYIYHQREWADEMADGICCCPEKRVGGVHYKYVQCTLYYGFQCLAKVTFAQSDYKSDLRLARLANTAVPLECLSSCTGSSSYIYILYIPRDALRKTLRGFMGQQ